MSTLPSPTKVAGSHFSLYENYYRLVDPNDSGQIAAIDAAKFLKKSHLSDVILSKIWDIADSNSRGFLDKPGMFVALKLCALAQQGHHLSISNICMDVSPPKMGEILNTLKTNTCTPSTPLSLSNSCWSINPMERVKYEQLFHSLEPVNGYIPGNKVKGVLMDSKLPLETLGKIWDLADIDKDGKLSQHEFIVAMHLVYKALEKNAVPNVLPDELMDNSITNKTDSSLKTQIPDSRSDCLPSNKSSPNFLKETKSCEWIVSYEDKKAADKLFTQADEDLDGFVSGIEIKDIFFQSGLSQSVLAHIWNLCDISQSGKLNDEQFALSMWLIKQKLNGIELPTKLSSEMIPPSLRKQNIEQTMDNNNPCNYSNPELDMINKDISEMINEKHTMEQDISQKEADYKIKSGEIKSLQSEFDTLAATLRQLDNQKGEAQKRLNDLKIQVDKLRQRAIDQESTLNTQEAELNNKRQEIESLKLTEHNLEVQQHEYVNQLKSLSSQLQNIQLQTSQIKANMTQLEEQQQQIVNVITQYDAAFTIGDASTVSDTSLLFEIKFDEAIYNFTNMNRANIFGKEANVKDSVNNNEKLHDNNSFTTLTNNGKYARQNQDPFQADFDSEKENRSFSTDVFDNSNKSLYDPFNDEATQNCVSTHSSQVKDPFGEDPFAALHAPMRSDSPSPALPPKKSKQPPPRPAPPRPSQGPQGLMHQSISSSTTSITTNADPFADKISFNNASSGTTNFADFANFDSKPIHTTEDFTENSEINSKINIDPLIVKKFNDFEEDPFQNYQYEDLSTISDLFYNNIEHFKVDHVEKKGTAPRSIMKDNIKLVSKE